MAVASWMLRSRSLRTAKALRNRGENKDDVVRLDFDSDPKYLILEILNNICQKHGLSSVKKLNYLNAFVHLVNKNSKWISPDTFGLNTEEILCCLRVALIQDSVQVRAAGLRALRYIIRTEEDVLCLNKLQFPYLISRSLDLLLKTDNERVLMSERIQSLKVMRHILTISPQNFSRVLVRALVSVVLRPVEDTDRLLKACVAVLCELCVLNNRVFVKCDGVRALLRNARTIPSSHMIEAICGALLFLLNKPSTREFARVDLRYLISGYTDSLTSDKNCFREEERRLSWTNSILLTLLRSSGGLFELCDDFCGLKSKAIIELLFELINIPQPEWTDNENVALESVERSKFQEFYRLTEGYVVAEGKRILPNMSKNRVNLVEVYCSLLLYFLLEIGLPDALVEVIVSSDSFLSLQACILLGEFLHLSRNLLPSECFSVPPSMPNLIAYATRGCPVHLPSKSFLKNSSDNSPPLNEQYSPSFSNYSKDFHYNDDKLRYPGDYSKILDVRLPSNLNIPDNFTTVLTNSSPMETTTVTKDRNMAVFNHQDVADDLSRPSHVTRAFRKIPSNRCKSAMCDAPSPDVLYFNHTDFPVDKQKQRMALMALSVLSNLQKQLEKPRRPASLLLSNVIQYGETTAGGITSVSDFGRQNSPVKQKKKTRKLSPKEFEDLIKATRVLVVPVPSRWKWESVRILLKLGLNDPKKLNDANFKTLTKKLIYFYKPSSKKYSHTALKSDCSGINIYTIVACDLLDVLLDVKNNDGSKLLMEFLQDFDNQLKQITEVKSVHDCLLSPQRLTNSLSQDYFLLIGRLSNTESGLALLKKLNILQRLHYIAVNINLDCYVKLIVSGLSYITSEDTRKLLNAVLSCSFASSRLYATKYLHVLIRTSASKHESFRNWAIEMLVNQLHDENQSVSMAALNALNEAADHKDYLDVLISLRPSLLHLGDKGLLLLIRFLSVEKGFTYLQAANFVAPQLLRWASSYNFKYTQIVEGELHDSMTQYQRGEDGRYRQRLTGTKAALKDMFVPPHLYGQLVQHSQGFNLMVKQDIVSKMIQIIFMADCNSDMAILELKSALWALGHFATSSSGARFLSDRGVVQAIAGIAEKCAVYSVKITAFYILSMIATTKEGVSAINKTVWRCLKCDRHASAAVAHDILYSYYASFDKYSDEEDSETVASPMAFESPQSEVKTTTVPLNHGDEEIGLFKTTLNSKFSFEKKSATLPQRGGLTSQIQQIQHNRSFSESKADASDDWSSSGSPPSNTLHKPPIDHAGCRSDSYGTDSSTSGISSCDSIYGKPSNYSERISTLSPIPSTSSLTTAMPLMPDTCPREYRTFLLSSRRHSSISFGCRLSAQNALGYKTLRMLQNRHHLGNTPCFSASATMEYLSAHERRQMSPLVRPKFPRYIHEPLIHEFEVKSAPPFEIGQNESVNNISSTIIESSRFSHSTEIDEEEKEVEPCGPCYRGICLPLKLSCVLPRATNYSQNFVFTQKTYEKTKSTEETDLSLDSDSEINVKNENENVSRTSTSIQRKRRHDKSACMLCSLKNNDDGDHANADRKSTVRSRKTSTSSLHRIRTETESSYGGGIGAENESPILLTWQQKAAGLIGTTPGGASSGTLETSDSPTALIANNENTLKSRSILRKEVLKLIEQLGNPALYKTCKQGLLHLKQICGDLFQDICLFCDVCSLLASINYRIQARQLIQDLFLEAPFYELYEEPLSILSRASLSQDASDTRTCSTDTATIATTDSMSFVDSKPPLPYKSNNKDTLSEICAEDRKINHNLEVIVESDAISETTRSDRDSMIDSINYGAEEKQKQDYGSSIGDRNVNDECWHIEELTTKNHRNCRRAYSYPAANYVVTDFGCMDLNTRRFKSDYTCISPVAVPTVRSRSFSAAACSYISQLSFEPKVFQNDSKRSLTTDSFLSHTSDHLCPSNKFSECSLVSMDGRPSPVVVRLQNPYDVLNINVESKLVIDDKNCDDEFDYGRNKNVIDKQNPKDILMKSMTDAVHRHRKIAAIESPDANLLLKHNPNI